MKVEFSGGAIRAWAYEDVPELVRLADNRAVWLNLRDAFPNPYTRKDARAWVKGVTRQLPMLHFAITAQGALAGGIGLILHSDIHTGSAEVGYWLGEPFWGRGIMTAALSAFTDHAFEALKLRRIYALALEWNLASARVLEKSGYAREARMRKSAIKDGRVADEFLYAKVK